SPPRIKPTKTYAKLTSRRAMPPSAMIAPARMKNGIASRVNLFTPLVIWIINASSGRSIHSAPATALKPTAKATGIPSASKMARVNNKTNASIVHPLTVIADQHDRTVFLRAKQQAFKHKQDQNGRPDR